MKVVRSLWSHNAVFKMVRANSQHQPLKLYLTAFFTNLADTIGKQDAFDWGNGWAAVRAICWSPFDDFVFATTGNVRTN